MMNKKIEIRQLSRNFNDKKVLDSINLELQVGELIMLQGPNGAGKTTLLRVLSTLLTPTSGQVLVFGKDISKSQKELRAFIGWAPTDDRGFNFKLTGFENLLFFAALKGVSKKAAISCIDQLRHIQTFSEALEKPYYLCSSGMKQSLRIVQTLLHRPRLILLDEPFRNLDVESQKSFMKAFAELAKEAVVIISSHNSDSSSQQIIRHVFLHEGSLVSPVASSSEERVLMQ